MYLTDQDMYIRDAKSPVCSQAFTEWTVLSQAWPFWLCGHHGHMLPSPQTSQGQFLGNDSHFTREKKQKTKPNCIFKIAK